jgi:hypothetical protein
MSLQERLKNLRPHVVGIRFVKEMPVVDVNLKETWVTLKSDKILVNKSEKVENYYMFYSQDTSTEIDEILNFVERVIEYNKESEAKDTLLKTHISTLKELFQNSSYEQLKKLEFKLPKELEEKEEI